MPDPQRLELTDLTAQPIFAVDAPSRQLPVNDTGLFGEDGHPFADAFMDDVGRLQHAGRAGSHSNDDSVRGTNWGVRHQQPACRTQQRVTTNQDRRKDDPANRDRRDYPPASSLNHAKMIHVGFRVFWQDATVKSSLGSTL